MDPNLPKQIISSLCSYCEEVAQNLNIEFFVEGIDEPRDEHFQKDSALLRMTGPVLYEGSDGVEWYGIEVQVLLTDIIQRNSQNAYNIYDWAGAYQVAFQAPVPIFDFQTPPEDDILIGCLEPDKKVRNNVRVTNLGVVDPNLRVRQMSINARFILWP